MISQTFSMSRLVPLINLENYLNYLCISSIFVKLFVLLKTPKPDVPKYIPTSTISHGFHGSAQRMTPLYCSVIFLSKRLGFFVIVTLKRWARTHQMLVAISVVHSWTRWPEFCSSLLPGLAKQPHAMSVWVANFPKVMEMERVTLLLPLPPKPPENLTLRVKEYTSIKFYNRALDSLLFIQERNGEKHFAWSQYYGRFLFNSNNFRWSKNVRWLTAGQDCSTAD